MSGLPRRHILLFASVVSYFFIAFFCVKKLTYLEASVDPDALLAQISLALTALFFPLILSWLAFRWVAMNVLLTASLGFVAFVSFTSSTPLYLWNALFVVTVVLVLYYLVRHYDQERASLDTDFEKSQDQLNDVQVSYKLRGEGISVFFEKYSTYYNLRKLAEDLARMLSIDEVTKTIVDQAFQFISRGNYCVITLVQSEGARLPVIAKKTLGQPDQFIAQEGNGYDLWVIRNRKRLIVTDAHSDFRFASQTQVNAEGLRSLIVTPLMSDGRVMGTFGLYSRHSNVYTHDDLRLLDAIATLASSAISNSMLYERTNELAIRDSLTGLYVRRYFYSRLKEEHRRALSSHKSLSVLMCDLDHFKSLNDQFGHQAGDLILTQFTQVLSKYTEGAVVARYGGEEFAVIFPETPKQQALQWAEQIRAAVEETKFQVRRQDVGVTVSIGLASLPDDTLEIDALVHKADEALYAAKKAGRNQVCSAL